MKLRDKNWIFAKSAYIFFKNKILWLISLSWVFTAVYYALFSRAYIREQRAVVAGLNRHFTDLKNESSLFLLRRNVHRIEKGLVMPRRRPVFAKEYIGETVDYYNKCVSRYSEDQMPLEITWSRNVLLSYFGAVESASEPLIDQAKESFFTIEKNRTLSQSIPYMRGEQPSPVSYNDLHRLVHQRKSTRTFLKKSVPRNLVDKAVEIASKAPSSCNRQPTHYRIYDEPELRKEMTLLPLGAAGFADNIPMICALTGDLSAYFYERDRHSIYIDGCLSAMLFMLALETVGLASCPLNWAEINELDRKFETKIGIPKHERVIMFIAIGYPDPEGHVAFSEKRDLDLLSSYNRVEKG
ncbi:MAG: nitroreductase family protein [Desulfobacterales bacterium]|nr:nitroreductase family protein [Desulfobacterales bacterium]